MVFLWYIWLAQGGGIVNERIKEVRKRFGLTQTQFAKKINLSQNYMTMVETGKRSPSDRTVEDICRVFGVSRDWLEAGTGEMFQPDSDDVVMQAFGELAARNNPTINSFIRWIQTKSDSELDAIINGVQECLDFIKADRAQEK